MGALEKTTMKELPEPSIISKDHHMFALVEHNCFMYEVQGIMDRITVKSTTRTTYPPRFIIIIRDEDSLQQGRDWWMGSAESLENLWLKYKWAKDYPWAVYEIIF